MAVRKKTSTSVENHDSMSLASELKEVRKHISNLPQPDEGANMTTDTKENTAGEATGGTVRKKVKPAPAPKAKRAAAAASNGADKTTLADICKSVKGLEPRAARRYLRQAKVKNPGRWSWPKGSGDIAKVKKVLTDAVK